VSQRSMVKGLAIALGAAALIAPCAAYADRTVLVGGTVIDGKAARKGDKVIIQTESGEIAVPADSVQRIEKSESSVSRFEAQYATLPKGDARARLVLADFCRDHGMRVEEHRLLLEVLDIDRDNPAARARLGYEKTASGWITHADAMRAKGFVERDGQWLTPADAARAEQERADREAAVARRDAEEAELQARRAQLSAQQAALEAEAGRLYDPPYSVYTPYYGYGYGYGAVYPNRFARPIGATTFRPVRAPLPPLERSFLHDDTSMSVVKVPYRRR
jgi:hypothetical protein